MRQTGLSISEYPLPQTIEIERQVLADAIASPDAIGQMMAILSPESFTDENRARIWSSLTDSFVQGNTIDLVSVHAKFGNAFINEVITPGLIGGTSREAINHARSLRNANARRITYISAIRLLQESIRPENTESDLCAIAESVSRNIQGEASDVMEKPIGNVIDDISREIAANAEATRSGIKTRVPTGFPTLDGITFGGWCGGQLIILAARPSVGKTAVMLQMAKASAQAGFSTCIFSIEMTNSELGKRMLFSTGYIMPNEVASGFVDATKFNAAASGFRRLPLFINEKSRNIDEVVARITLNARSGKCRAAFIDYLGLMDAGDSRMPLYQVVGKITATLKNTAKMLGIPIILLCQMNRAAAMRGDAPQLYDLRDSGSIEQDADIVIMLDNNEDNLDLWIRKNRQYKKNVCITVQPNATYSSFTELSNNIGYPINNPEPDLPLEDEYERL